MALIIAELPEADVRVSHCHLELELHGEDLKKFKALSPEYKQEYMDYFGLLYIDDTEMLHTGSVGNIEIHE